MPAACPIATQIRRFAGGTVVAIKTAVPMDVAIGRALACCVHPVVAWRRLTAYGRVGLVAAYVSASYVTMLAALLLA